MQYLKLEQEIGFRVKQKLKENNVEYLWQSRAKDPHSLETKLRGRKHKYSNDQANCAAIKDLIGCRIVLPRLTSDIPTVKALIQSYFNFLGEKSHPEQGSTGGYVGFHFYVAMKQHGSQDVRIEIQVMSPSQYNYAFYDHDVLYK
ncbi:hypothetical protein HYALB_00010421 [Hymenoscyphus albidus]|uniref:RelA/SpoT domain-containing protein n=1 Tax=Hymenoscyphus albidus TaxID=595503 RepID=A0A9N9M647_9HELO|nr:hypothetical protein HYALB_00010421 [Hymenoscyphus albidus]